MGSRTSVPPKSTSSGHASTARNARPSARSSVPPTSAAARTSHKSYENVNNKSLVVRIDYGSVSFLFVGDAMENAELDMLASGVNLDVDVLKVAHHGADTSSGLDFLRAVSPNVAVISCGANSSDHPGTETMSRLQQTAGLVLRTDEMGEIAVFTDGSKLSYITQK